MIYCNLYKRKRILTNLPPSTTPIQHYLKLGDLNQNILIINTLIQGCKFAMIKFHRLE